MRSMPRVDLNFEELEHAEIHCPEEDLSIDHMLDEMFADELDIDFSSKKPPVGIIEIEVEL